MTKRQCEYCPPDAPLIDTRGYPSHIHFRHRKQIVAQFAADPIVQAALTIADLSLAGAGMYQKQLPAAPAAVEAAIAEYDDLEELLALELSTRKISAADIAAGRIPADIAAGVRLLVQLDDALHACDLRWLVWSVPVFEKQCEHRLMVVGAAFVDRCPICGQRNPKVRQLLKFL